tara:strand:+ start:11132 stop:11308 length:177 start_codon:yes stop_codon:yes gene_type:complete
VGGQAIKLLWASGGIGRRAGLRNQSALQVEVRVLSRPQEKHHTAYGFAVFLLSFFVWL